MKSISSMVGVVGSAATVMHLLVNQIAAQRGRIPPWPIDLDDTVAEQLIPHLDALGDIRTWGAAELGQAYIHTMSADARAQGGVYYTPEPIADAMAYAALAPRFGDRRHVRVWDPACGAGVFLQGAACMLARRDWDIPPHVISAAVYGTDIDPIAVDIAKSALWLRSTGTRPISWLDGNVVVADPLTGALPPHLGPDPGHLVILGNPPYRSKAKGAAPWIEKRRAPGESTVERPSMEEFRNPEYVASAQHLSSLVMFFWRLVLWRVFEARTGTGVVALLVPRSIVDGNSFGAARRLIQQLADEIWLIDLSPEGTYPPSGHRVFPEVKLPVAIVVLARLATRVDLVIRYIKTEGAAEHRVTQVRAACSSIAQASVSKKKEEELAA